MTDKRTLFIGEQAVPSRGLLAVTDSYTLAAEDVNKIITATKGTAMSITLPPQADVEIPVGSFVKVVQLGAGAVTIAPGSGVTLRNGLATAKPLAQYASLTATKIATDTWFLEGNPALS